MNLILVYDIVQDRRRAKVADACLDYGLDRVQYSTFVGILSRTHQEELLMRIKDIVGDTPASVHLYPIDEKAWKKRLILEQAIEKVEESHLVPQSADE